MSRYRPMSVVGADNLRHLDISVARTRRLGPLGSDQAIRSPADENCLVAELGAVYWIGPETAE